MVTSSGRCLRKSFTTSEWSFPAARWSGVCPLCPKIQSVSSIRHSIVVIVVFVITVFGVVDIRHHYHQDRHRNPKTEQRKNIRRLSKSQISQDTLYCKCLPHLWHWGQPSAAAGYCTPASAPSGQPCAAGSSLPEMPTTLCVSSFKPEIPTTLSLSLSLSLFFLSSHFKTHPFNLS